MDGNWIETLTLLDVIFGIKLFILGLVWWFFIKARKEENNDDGI